MANISYHFAGVIGQFNASALKKQLGGALGVMPSVLVSADGSSAIITLDDAISANTVNAAMFALYPTVEFAPGAIDSDVHVIAADSDGEPAIWYDSDGVFYAGDGAIVMDATGINVGGGAAIMDSTGISVSYGAIVMDELGVTRTGINYFDRWDGVYDDVSRRLEMGISLLAGSTTPSAYMMFTNPAAGTNLQTNGDFELGALTDFDAADSGTPVWSADSATYYDGAYSAKLTTTLSNDGSELQTNGGFETADFTGWTQAGTGTWDVTNVSPYAGTYHARLSQTASQTATLTTNLGGTPRMAVTAGLYYAVSMRYYTTSAIATYFSTASIAVKWYTATSGGSLISTDTLACTSSGSYIYSGLAVLAPATAAGAEIVVTWTRNATAGTIVTYFDALTFKASQYGSLTTNLGATPRMAVTGLESYRLGYYTKQSNANSAGVWKKQELRVNWYTATSGGSLISTDTVAATMTQSWQNFEGTLTAPSTALGAEIVAYFVRANNNATRAAETSDVYLDSIAFELVDVSAGIRFMPNVTIVDAPLNFQELAAPSAPSSGYGSLYADQSGNLRHVNDLTQNVVLAKTTPTTTTNVSNSAAETTVVSGTIEAGSLGNNGVVTLSGEVLVKNNKGSAGTFDMTFYFGATSLKFLNATGIANSATTRYTVRWEVTVKNIAATNVQEITGLFNFAQDIAASTVAVSGPRIFWLSAAIDTTADVLMKTTIKLSAASTSFFANASGSMDGPYYAA